MPDDPDVEEFNRKRDKILTRIDTLGEEIKQIRQTMPNANEIARYEGPQGVVARLQWTENNLINKLQGRKVPANFEGGKTN